MTLHTAIVFMLTLSVFVASPGPGVLGVVGTSMKSGLRASVFFILGMICGDMVYLLFAVFGLAAMASVMGRLFYLVRAAGGAYLIYVGIKMMMAKGSQAEQAGVKSRRSNALAGFLITISNPKVIIMYCGFLPNFMDLAALKPIDILSVAGIVAVVISCVMGSYAVLAAKTGGLLSRRSSKFLNRAAGCVVISIGSVLILKKSY